MAVIIPMPPINAQASVPALATALRASREYRAKKSLSVKIMQREAKTEIINGSEIAHNSRTLPSG
jgi:hypothetical protein